MTLRDTQFTIPVPQMRESLSPHVCGNQTLSLVSNTVTLFVILPLTQFMVLNLIQKIMENLSFGFWNSNKTQKNVCLPSTASAIY